MCNVIYLSLGTNLGEKSDNLKVAYKLLEESGVKIVKAAKIMETTAWGIEDQPDFLNQVIQVDFAGAPYGLLKICQNVERNMGRVMPDDEGYMKWGPRIIDIDILQIGNIKMRDSKLTLPHHTITKDYIVGMIREIENL